ncbi:MAG TPA: NADP-dependent oxidoreductase [Thermodesulfobacteriota bacterium]
MATRRAGARGAPVVPETMKAAAVDRFGPPDALALHTLPVPEPGPRQVLVAVHAAGVGVWDAAIRDGSWQPAGRARFPLIPGIDGAGIVASTGARVRRPAVGDRVYALEVANPQGGFYAEYVAVDAEHAAPVPRRLDMREAAAAATTGLTALQGIDDTLRLRSGESVLIFGASGAVGTLAVQFAKRRRARVLGTATGRAATALVRRLGADAVFDARARNAADRLRELAPDGLDAVLALAGGDELERCLDLVRSGGRIAYPNGIDPEPRRRRGIRILPYDGVPGRQEFARLDRAVAEARLRVPIAAVYPLAQAAKAHARLARGQILGRIVLEVRRGRAR